MPSSAATYRRWVVAPSLGEFAAFTVPTTVWAVSVAAGLGDQAAYLPVVIGGAGEGAVLGFAQSRALRADLPDLDTRNDRVVSFTLASSSKSGAPDEQADHRRVRPGDLR